MPYHFAAPVIIEEQSTCIAELPAVVQCCRFLEFLGYEPTQTAAGQCFVPNKEVTCCAEERAATATIVVQLHIQSPAIVILFVGEGTILDDFTQIVLVG